MSDRVRYHIGFGPDELGEPPPRWALLCGDPDRARRIACDTAGVTCLGTLSERRGLSSYLARSPGGVRFIAATSGMGAPSLSIVVNELAGLGVQCVIRVGTCGSIQDRVRAGDLVISSAALCRQGAADDIAPAEYPAAAHPLLTAALVEAARTLPNRWHLGVTASVDTFFEGQERTASSANPRLLRRLHGITEEYRNLGILNYEMEAGTLFKMAGVYGLAAGCVCAVLAERTASEAIAATVKDQAERAAIVLALATIDRVSPEDLLDLT